MYGIVIMSENIFKLKNHFVSTSTPTTNKLGDGISATYFQDLNCKQTRLRYTGNAFLGLQQRYFWQNVWNADYQGA